MALALEKKMRQESQEHQKTQAAWMEGERERLHRQMLSSVSHDLKTPLASIIGSLEIYQRMKDELSPEKKNMLVETALHEARRLDTFVTNILDMAKLEEGKLSLQRSGMQLKHLVEDCVGRLSGSSGSAEIKIMHTGNAEAFIDAGLLSRALQHLIDNALKHCPPPVRVSISYGVSDHFGFITVQDNGPGIPPEREEEIFNKYTRLSKTDYQTAGTGLGLSISRAIARRHGGDVHVRNRQEGGAEFTLRFRSDLNEPQN